jgi:hypothetical protein
MGYPTLGKFREELEGQPSTQELGMVVQKSFDIFDAELARILELAGLQSDGTFNNLVVNNLTVNNLNNNQNVGILLRATRTFTNAQILASPGTPLQLLKLDFTGTAPGVGFACNVLRCDWTMDSSAGVYGNIGSSSYLFITHGASTSYFGSQVTGAHLMDPALGIQQVTTGMFEPSTILQPSSTYENQALYAFIGNLLGDFTGGHADNTLIVNVWYVITPVTSSTATNTIVYTTTARKVEPPAANRIAVTPSATPFANSNWFEVDASTSADWALAAVAFDPGLNAANTCIFDVGIGAIGSEVAIATISGRVVAENTCANHRLAWMVPVLGISSGDRVSVRMRKSGTDTTNWTVALEYFELPMLGNAVTSPVAPVIVPSIDNTLVGTSNITPSAVSGSYSAWTLQTNASPLPNDIVISGVVTVTASNTGDMHYEMSVGGGLAGDQTIHKSRGNAKDVSTLGQGGPYHQICYPAMPIMRAGDGLGFRLRKVNTDVTVWGGVVTAYPGIAFPLLTTEQPNKWYPDTGNTLVPLTQSAAPWGNAAYAVLFTTTTPIAVMAVLVNLDTTTTGIEIDVATGTPGNEVVKATVRMEAQGVFSGDVQPIPLVLARNIDVGEIISLRCRTSSTVVGVGAGIGYMENPDFYQRVDTASVAYPAAANGITVAGHNTAWNNSLYGELHSNIPAAVYLTHLNYMSSGVSNVDVEFDLATGAALSETVIGTFTTHIGNSNSGGNGQIPIVPPVRIAAGVRLAVRFRKTGTSTAGWIFSACATPV